MGQRWKHCSGVSTYLDKQTNKKQYNDEEKKYEDILDENGNKIIKYGQVDGKILAEAVLPFFDELMEALEE